MERKVLNFLLVEDDDNHAHLVERSLKRESIANSVVRVDDGEKALLYLHKKPPYQSASRPDLVLLDLNLPKVDGLEVLKGIKTSPDLARIPVVVITTSAAERDRIKAYEFHANSYLVKPVEFEKFREMVQELISYWGKWNVQAP